MCAVLVAGLSVSQLAGCSSSQDAVVASIGPEKLTLSEFERQYIKSNGSREAGAAASQEERERFLGLLVKYRLKLADAYRRGVDRDPEVMNEISQYRGSLAASYLTDREVVSPGVRNMYNRRSEEIRASHILLELPPTATAAESTAAYAKAAEIVAEIKKGADFGDLAVKYSKDPSAQQNRGDLYYFTAGQMVSPFEDAAFALHPGEISNPIRTTFGLHIIKCVDRRPVAGELRASHIMVRFNSADPSPADTATAYAQALSLRDSLKAGADFAGLAQRHSGDPGSAGKGGDLGYFSRRRWPRPFDDTVFTLKVGSVSNIVRTGYGYHLILLTEVRPFKPFDEMRAELQQTYQQVRFPEEYATYLAALRKETGYARNDQTLAALLTSVDSTKSTRDSAWAASVPPDVRGKTLFSFAGHPVTVDSALGALRDRPDLGNVQLRAQSFTQALDKVAENLMFTAKSFTLEKRSPEFASILNEYTDGILLYQTEQEKVWRRIETTDSTLRIFFDKNRDRFVFPDRLIVTSLHSPTEASAKILYDRLKAGATFDQLAVEDSIRMARPASFTVDFARGSSRLPAAAKKVLQTIAAEMTSNTAVHVVVTARPDTTVKKAQNARIAAARLDLLKKEFARLGIPAERTEHVTAPQGVKATNDSTARAQATRNDRVELSISNRRPLVLGVPEHTLLARDADDRARRADSLKSGQYSVPFAYRGFFSIIRLDGLDPSRRKTYEEAGPEVSTAFQDFESKRLETAWIDSLRAIMPVKEYPEVLKNAFAPAR
jgi:peptidyl-prolyl cis-trans isomerase SurA